MTTCSIQCSPGSWPTTPHRYSICRAGVPSLSDLDNQSTPNQHTELLLRGLGHLGPRLLHAWALALEEATGPVGFLSGPPVGRWPTL